MRVAAISAAILAFAGSVIAQTAGFDVITKPAEQENVPAGSTYDIIWAPGTVTGTITLSVIGGATPATLVDKGLIASNVDNTLGKYSWAVPTTLGADAVYGIKIVLDADPATFQFSFPFHIVGGGSGTPGGNTTTVTSVSSTATVTVTVSSASGNGTLSTRPSSSTLTSANGGQGGAGGVGGGTTTSTRVVTQTRASTTTTAASTPNAAVAPAAGPLALLGGLVLAALAL